MPLLISTVSPGTKHCSRKEVEEIRYPSQISSKNIVWGTTRQVYTGKKNSTAKISERGQTFVCPTQQKLKKHPNLKQLILENSLTCFHGIHIRGDSQTGVHDQNGLYLKKKYRGQGSTPRASPEAYIGLDRMVAFYRCPHPNL